MLDEGVVVSMGALMEMEEVDQDEVPVGFDHEDSAPAVSDQEEASVGFDHEDSV